MSDIFAQPALFTIMDGLVAMFNQPLSDGKTFLSANSDAMQQPLPSIEFRTGSFTTTEFDRWNLEIAWRIPAVVKVEGTAEDPGDSLRHVVEDIFRMLIFYRGLPLKLNRDGDELILTSWNDPEGTAFCNRGGPYLSSFSTRNEEHGSPLRSADLVFTANYLANYEPTWQKYPIKKIVLGVNVFDPTRTNSLIDRNNWVNSDPDVAFAWGVYQKPDTLINYQNPAPLVPSEQNNDVLKYKYVVTPAAATIPASGQIQFGAFLEDQYGVQTSLADQVQWATAGVFGWGIGATGLFSPNGHTGTGVVRANNLGPDGSISVSVDVTAT